MRLRRRSFHHGARRATDPTDFDRFHHMLDHQDADALLADFPDDRDHRFDLDRFSPAMTSSRSSSFGLIASAFGDLERLRSGPPSASAR